METKKASVALQLKIVPSTEMGKNGGETGVLLLYSEGANGSGVYIFKKTLNLYWSTAD